MAVVRLHELAGHRKRYRVLSVESLCEALGFDSVEELHARYREGIARRLAAGELARERCWTEALAVGSKGFVERMARSLRNRLELELTLVPHPAERNAQLSKIYVRRAQRGCGIGKAIVRFVEERCVERGIRELWLTVNRHNTDSMAFYRKTGFSRSGSVVQDIGDGFLMDDDKMVKRIW